MVINDLKKKKRLSGQAGFTLIEMLIALSIFTLALLVATDLFQRIIEGQRNTITSINIQESMRYAFEIIAKEGRNAQPKVGECVNLQPSDNDNTYSTLKLNGTPVGSTQKGHGKGPALALRNKYGQCTHYYLENGRLMISRNGIAYPITPQNIRINNLSFFVIGPTGPKYDNERWSATIYLQAEVGLRASEKHTLDMQTTITSRNYDAH